MEKPKKPFEKFDIKCINCGSTDVRIGSNPDYSPYITCNKCDTEEGKW
jgi:hypothetical protein